MNSDFADEEELSKYLRDMYNKVYEADSNIFSSAQMIVTISLHFMKQRNTESPQVHIYSGITCIFSALNHA